MWCDPLKSLSSMASATEFSAMYSYQLFTGSCEVTISDFFSYLSTTSVSRIERSRRQLPPPITQHPPTQSTKRPNRGMLIYCNCVRPAIADITPSFTSYFSHQTSYIFLSSALHSPNLRAYLSHIPGNLRTQSP